MSYKRKPIHHGGRGKQHFISSSATPVPQELVHLSSRAQELHGIERKPLKLLELQPFTVSRSLHVALSPGTAQQVDLGWTNPGSIPIPPQLF